MDRKQFELLQRMSKELLVYRFALDEVNTKLKILNEEMNFVQNYNPIEHIKTRLKNPKSILDKLQRKGLSLQMTNIPDHIFDIAGVRVICSFNEDVYQVFEMLCSQNDIKVLEVKDYIKDPKPNGYQSLHVIVTVPVFMTKSKQDVPVEIQIRTVAMDFWASLEHKIYYKYKDNIPDDIRYELKDTADTITRLDRRMAQLNESVRLLKVHAADDPTPLIKHLN